MNTEQENPLHVILNLLIEMQGDNLNAHQLASVIKKPVLDTADMAVIFQKGKRTINLWHKKGEIEGATICGHYYYTLADLLKALQRKGPKKKDHGNN